MDQGKLACSPPVRPSPPDASDQGCILRPGKGHPDSTNRASDAHASTARPKRCLELLVYISSVAGEAGIKPAGTSPSGTASSPMFDGIADADVFKPRVFERAPLFDRIATAPKQWRKDHGHCHEPSRAHPPGQTGPRPVSPRRPRARPAPLIRVQANAAMPGAPCATTLPIRSKSAKSQPDRLRA